MFLLFLLMETYKKNVEGGKSVFTKYKLLAILRDTTQNKGILRLII